MKVAITFVSPDGRRTPCDGLVGESVMLVALVHGVGGVLAECGGSLACGTCHVYVEETQVAWLEAADPDEEAMLDMTAAPRRATSRLACQIGLNEALDGLVIHLPDRQV